MRGTGSEGGGGVGKWSEGGCVGWERGTKGVGGREKGRGEGTGDGAGGGAEGCGGGEGGDGERGRRGGGEGAKKG